MRLDEGEEGEEARTSTKATCGNATFAEITIRALQKE